MTLGPLQLLIVEFEHSHFTGEIETEMANLESAGTVRVLDLIVVAKDEAGTIVIERRGEGAEADADVLSVAHELAPGAAAAIAVLEHRWALPLHDAIERAGGRAVVDRWAEPAELEGLGVPLPAE